MDPLGLGVVKQCLGIDRNVLYIPFLALALLQDYNEGTLLGTPNREPQEYSRNRIGTYLPGSLHPMIFLLYSLNP